MGYVQELVYGRIKNGKSNPNFGHWFGDDWNGDPHPAVSTDPSISKSKECAQHPNVKNPDSASSDGNKKCKDGEGKNSGNGMTSDEQNS